jgi:hypothetical protein
MGRLSRRVLARKSSMAGVAAIVVAHSVAWQGGYAQEPAPVMLVKLADLHTQPPIGYTGRKREDRPVTAVLYGPSPAAASRSPSVRTGVDARLVYVAFWVRVCCGVEMEEFSRVTPEIVSVAESDRIRAHGDGLRVPRVKPLWIRPGAGFLQEAGIEPPEQTEAVAAFPREAGGADRTFMVYKRIEDGRRLVFWPVGPR